jgi:putative inorganic carbon (HCO3(-)) transporter
VPAGGRRAVPERDPSAIPPVSRSSSLEDSEVRIRAWSQRARILVLILGMVVFSGFLGFALVFVRPVLLFGVLAGLAGVLVIMARPFWGLLLYTLVYLLRPAEIFPSLAVLHLERVLGIVALAAMFFEMARKTGQVYVDRSRQTAWFLIFLGTMILSIPFSYWTGWATTTFVDMLKVLAFYLMIVHLADTPKRIRIFTWTYLVMVTYIAVSSLRAYYAGRYAFAQGIDRAVGQTSAGGDPNNLGATLASAVPLFILLLGPERGFWRRFLLVAALVTAVWTVVLTGSRSSLLGLLAAFGFLIWTSRHRVAWGFAALAVLAVGFVLLPTQYKQRYETIAEATSGELDPSSQSRIRVWKAGLHMFLDHPIVGVGAGCFGTAHALAYSPDGDRSWLQAHDLYIQAFAELGILGAVAFFGFVFHYLKLARRAYALALARGPTWALPAAVTRAVLGGTLVLLVSGVFGHNLYRSTWYMFAAMGLAVFRLSETTPDEETSTVPPAPDGAPS